MHAARGTAAAFYTTHHNSESDSEEAVYAAVPSPRRK